MMVLDNSHRITVTNYLTPNQSNGGDASNPELLTLNQRTGTDALGDTTGFTGVGTTPATISSSTEQAHSGTRSLKVVTSGGTTLEGVSVASTIIKSSTAYVAGVWVYAPLGATLSFKDYTNGQFEVFFTGTGAWQWVEAPFTSNTTATEMRVKTNGSQAITFYVDDCRLGLNVTTDHTSLYSAVLSVTGETSYQGYRSLKVTTPGSVISEGVRISRTIYGIGNFTHHFWIKAPAGANLVVNVGNGVTATPNSVDISSYCVGEWTKVNLPASWTRNQYNSPSFDIKTQRTAQAITFYVDARMVETGLVAHDWIIGQGSYSFFRSRE